MPIPPKFGGWQICPLNLGAECPKCLVLECFLEGRPLNSGGEMSPPKFRGYGLTGSPRITLTVISRNFSELVSLGWHVCRTKLARNLLFRGTIFLTKMLWHFPEFIEPLFCRSEGANHWKQTGKEIWERGQMTMRCKGFIPITNHANDHHSLCSKQRRSLKRTSKKSIQLTLPNIGLVQASRCPRLLGVPDHLPETMHHLCSRIELSSWN